MANINSGWTGPNVADGGRTASQNYDTRYATALKLFSGEVYNAFNNASIAKGLVRSYTLRGGKSRSSPPPRLNNELPVTFQTFKNDFWY